MVDLELLEGVFAQISAPHGVGVMTASGKMVVGFDRSVIQASGDDLTISINYTKLGLVEEVIPVGSWMPIFKREAMPELKSVSVVPKTAQLSSIRIGKRSIPTFLCDRLFAKSIMNWYAKVGDFTQMPGVIAPVTPDVRPDTFQAITVLPAVSFLGEGDAILWQLTAFDVGSDIFAEAKTKADKTAIERTNDVLCYPHEYWQ